MIRAEAHSDDMAATARFDATPWFEQASDLAIFALFACELGGDYPADQVALFFDDTPGYDAVTDMYKYISAARGVGQGIGFECHVYEPDAMAWVLANRPTAVSSLLTLDRYQDQADLDGMAAGAADSTPYWDEDTSWTYTAYQKPVAATPAP